MTARAFGKAGVRLGVPHPSGRGGHGQLKVRDSQAVIFYFIDAFILGAERGTCFVDQYVYLSKCVAVVNNAKASLFSFPHPPHLNVVGR